ncbi:helix-turn-helix domain-containing protein [Streptomyces sp. ADI98-10]|uniref:helix-turn-helix domain-containing protein n=1 Tax=Streptomyces sp. ADI98-10 TaxID=1522763 RepID=UPI002405A197|nr:helix-turn-helix domain-containing protein [Streptomyces sp. ADI98-10]
MLRALHEATQRPAAAESSSAHGTTADAPATVELTAHEAAVLMGCSTEYARRLARTGRVLARRAGPAWLINRQALDTYRRGTAA